MMLLKFVIKQLRALIYSPIELLYYLPGGPLANMGLTNFLVKIISLVDAPLRRLLLKLHANSSN
jgi:hypothetical protein